MTWKSRQLGCAWVGPTPVTQGSADGGRSARCAVAPMNTMRAVAVVAPGVDGPSELPHPSVTNTRAIAIARPPMRSGYSRKRLAAALSR